MDQDQFDQFLRVFQSSQQTMFQQMINKMQEPKSQESISFSNLTPFENYDPKKEKFNFYLERFENYYTMKGIKDPVQIAQLLCVSIGSTHYNSLAAFLGPEKSVKDLKLDDLLGAFRKMLVPKKNVVVAQHYFLKVVQKENQTISEFVSALHYAVADCEFSVTCPQQSCKKTMSITDIFLRAQFVRGLRDNWLRENILQSNLTTFDDILSKALALEASKVDSKLFTQHSSSYFSNYCSDDINAVDDSINQLRKTSSSSTASRFSKRDRNQLDYKALGIENLCIRCGRNNHKIKDCRIDKSKIKCNLCNNQGHCAKVCITTLMKSNHSFSNQNSVNYVETDEENSIGQPYGINNILTIVDLFEVDDNDKYFINVQLNGKRQRFEVDSGAKYSLLSDSDFRKLKLNVPLETSTTVFRSYSGNIIQPLGKSFVNVSYNGKKFYGELYIVPNGHDSLLGRQWIRGLNIDLQELDSKNKHKSQEPQVNLLNSTDDIFTSFSNIFEEKIGCVPGFEVSLQLRDGVKPVFTKERNVPHALLERVDKELDSLVADGIISPVNMTDWGSPLVVIPKQDGGVRLCVDYKCGVNERLVQANTPIRRIDDVLNSLRGSRFFCKLDLYKAYLHIKVDEESSKIQTISTHRGTFRVHRLSFGIKTAPSEFNRILRQILMGLSKTEAYFDDIVVHGATIEECGHNLEMCLQRLVKFDLHLNRNKCSFFQESIEYLGHVVRFNEISKSSAKVSAIQNMPRPSNVDEVKRFLGLVTYYSRFIPNLSTMTYELRSLLKKGKKWEWTTKCETSFIKLKDELSSDRVLIPFDPTLPLILTTDASPTGIAAVLSHSIEGSERPIAYASRSLSTSETNYSQLDREALAIVFGVTHFYNYLYARHFQLTTDNEPLSRIFHQNKALPQMTSARLLRYASFLSGFNYTIKCKKGEQNLNVDCLSRAPLQVIRKTPDGSFGEEVHHLYNEKVFAISSEVITADIIKEETAKDSKLCEIVSDLKLNSKDSDYTLVDGIIFRQDRILVPSSLRSRILKELHETHLGMTKMKQLARRYVYWPNIDRDIERLVRGCENCAVVRPDPPKVPVHPWQSPEENWERVHIDYAGPFQNNFFLLVVDAKSKWAEVKIVRDAPTSSSTIYLLENICATHGYPQVMVSDNASIFQSEEFRSYCKVNGIFQKFIAPGHPATNGLAERNVQTLKNRLKSAANDPTPISKKVQDILFRYRATPLACGKSPAELYLNRKIRIRLDSIFPYKPERTFVPNPRRSFHVGERTQVRTFSNNRPTWEFGIIKKKYGSHHYQVELDSGRLMKRHINQLWPTLVKSCNKRSAPEIPEMFDIPRIPKEHTEQEQELLNPRQGEYNMEQERELVNPRQGVTNEAEQELVNPRGGIINEADGFPEPRRSSRNRKQSVRLNDYLIY